MELSELQEVRRQKADALRTRRLDPYPTRSARTHTTAQALALFEERERDDALVDGNTADAATVVGRIASFRHMGKTIFAHLRDGYGDLQLYIRKDRLGDELYESVLRLFDLGDFAQANGTLFRTKTGEVSLRVESITMLAKALNAPPEKWHGVQDVEIRFRQRYVDLIANAPVRRVFEIRSRTVSAIRQFLDGRDYLEVETPTLQPLYGGAAARPFTTFHNALGQTFYLRIADELYLKRLLVGGFERVYEICKDFRNEGIDRNHSPEFTMLEFYEAYGDYDSVAARTRDLVLEAARRTGRTVVPDGRGGDIDLELPWRDATLHDLVSEAVGEPVDVGTPLTDVVALAEKRGVVLQPGWDAGEVVLELYEKLVEHTLLHPTFVRDYPVSARPLAREHRDDPRLTEAWDLVVAGTELATGYSELVDAVEQRARLTAQSIKAAGGDPEAMQLDEDFLRALEHGMPPTGGQGMGIDRLVMTLTGQPVRETILFPVVRPEAGRGDIRPEAGRGDSRPEAGLP